MHHYRAGTRRREDGPDAQRPGWGRGAGMKRGDWGYRTFTAFQAVFTVVYSTEPAP